MMTIHDLDPYQLEELKWALVYGCPETNYKPLDKWPDEITMQDLDNYFGHYVFTEEDF